MHVSSMISGTATVLAVQRSGGVGQNTPLKSDSAKMQQRRGAKRVQSKMQVNSNR